jgi:hypothetical protein
VVGEEEEREQELGGSGMRRRNRGGLGQYWSGRGQTVKPGE